MFGKKALKEELEYVRGHNLRLEGEKWELLKENAQLAREKEGLKEINYANDSRILILEKEKKRLEDELKLSKKSNDSLVKSLNKKFTKDELIEQLASVIMDEGKDIQKENLVRQITPMFTVSERQDHNGVVEE